MSDRRKHRGAAPGDEEEFASDQRANLRAAVADLSWLLTRCYAEQSALKIVGDRYNLTARQRQAVRRCACGDPELKSRLARMVGGDSLSGRRLAVDGFNVLTTVEVALGRGVVLAGRDTVYRDIAGVHGTYRRIAETEPALAAICGVIDQLGCESCTWFLDRPVSNSGRLATIIREAGEAQGMHWRVILCFNPDEELRGWNGVVATADSEILDAAVAWLPLSRLVVAGKIPDAWVLDLGGLPDSA